MYLPKLREVKEALSSLFSAPYTTKFPGVQFKATPELRGIPKYNVSNCTGCSTCMQVCPASAIVVIDDMVNKIRTLKLDYSSCIHCGQCEENCITGEGIKLSNTYAAPTFLKSDPALFEICEKELVLCEICGEIIACKDHLLFVKDRLGAKAYSLPAVLLENQRMYFTTEEYKAKEHIRREDYIKEACPKCRQKIVIADEN